ncbi:MAG: exosortase A [Gammaproteobacteria bacterium]
MDMARTKGTFSSAWGPYLGLTAFLLFTLVALYRETFLSLATIWFRSDTFSHGVIIFPIRLFMVWTRRHELSLLQPRPSAWGLGLTLAASVAWFFARLADVLVVQQLCAMAMVPALVLTALGTQICRRLAFPLAYLIFAVPMGEILVPLLQDFTAAFVVRAVQLYGLPVFVEGRHISLPSGDWEVAATCSGIRYLMASAALASAYTYFTHRSAWRRTAFILLGFIAPVIANGLRAYGIVMLGHLSNMRIAVGVDHLLYGWLFFGVVMMLLFWLGSRWRETPSPASPVQRAVLNQSDAKAMAALAITPLALLTLASGVLANTLLISADNPIKTPLLVQAPVALSPWHGSQENDGSWQPRFLGANGFIEQTYTLHGQAVTLYIAYYTAERQGAELINSQNTLYDKALWRRIGETDRSVALHSGERVPVHESLIRGRDGSRVIWHFYYIAGRCTTNPLLAKLLSVWARVMRPGSVSGVVAFASDRNEESEAAHQTLKRFLPDFYEPIASTLAPVPS